MHQLQPLTHADDLMQNGLSRKISHVDGKTAWLCALDLFNPKSKTLSLSSVNTPSRVGLFIININNSSHASRHLWLGCACPQNSRLLTCQHMPIYCSQHAKFPCQILVSCSSQRKSAVTIRGSGYGLSRIGSTAQVPEAMPDRQRGVRVGFIPILQRSPFAG